MSDIVLDGEENKWTVLLHEPRIDHSQQKGRIHTVINQTKKVKKTDGSIARKAPELRVEQWIDDKGIKLERPIKLTDYEGKFKIIYCFQHWCPGCHTVGLPSLKKLVNKFKGNDKLAFLAVQTVFEGNHVNTYDKIWETQKNYDLKIPFGHDPGKGISTIMIDYRTGGTPWFIFIDKEDNILFTDFHINTDDAIKFLQETLN